STFTSSSTPSKLNPDPSTPAANPTPFCSTPLLLPTESFATPSAAYRLTSPIGVGGILNPITSRSPIDAFDLVIASRSDITPSAPSDLSADVLTTIVARPSLPAA